MALNLARNKKLMTLEDYKKAFEEQEKIIKQQDEYQVNIQTIIIEFLKPAEYFDGGKEFMATMLKGDFKSKEQVIQKGFDMFIENELKPLEKAQSELIQVYKGRCAGMSKEIELKKEKIEEQEDEIEEQRKRIEEVEEELSVYTEKYQQKKKVFADVINDNIEENKKLKKQIETLEKVRDMLHGQIKEEVDCNDLNKEIIDKLNEDMKRAMDELDYIESEIDGWLDDINCAPANVDDAVMICRNIFKSMNDDKELYNRPNWFEGKK